MLVMIVQFFLFVCKSWLKECIKFPLGYRVCIKDNNLVQLFMRFSSQGKVVKLLDPLRLNEVNKEQNV
jgi:hypothetical protein